MIKHPNSVRSKHPIQRFTAIGLLAHELMDKHTSESGGYDVLDRIVITSYSIHYTKLYDLPDF